DACPDLDDHASMKAFFDLIQALHRDDRLLAYHDIADGGLFATLAEMAFASRCGLAIDLPESFDALGALFAEELGAVVQVRTEDADSVSQRLAERNLVVDAIGAPTLDGRIHIRQSGRTLLDEARGDLHRAWSATTHALQRLRDNPDDADQEYARIDDTRDPGLSPVLTFDPRDDIAAPYIARGA